MTHSSAAIVMDNTNKQMQEDGEPFMLVFLCKSGLHRSVACVSQVI